MRDQKNQKNQKHQRKRILAALIALAVIAAMLLGMAVSVVRAQEEETQQSSAAIEAPDYRPETLKKQAVYIDNIDVTNMSYSEAERALNEHMEKLRGDSIVLYAGDNSAVTTAGAMGLSYTNKNIIEEALSIGKKGNVLKRFLADRQIRNEGAIVLDLGFRVDRGLVSQVIRRNKDLLNCEPRPNSLELSGKTFSVLPAKDGVRVDETASVDTVMQYIAHTWHGGQGGVALNAEILPSKDTADQLRNVRNLLGEATTEFDSSEEARATNIGLAAAHIHGTVLYPGEEFSSIEAIGPTEAEYGFALGASYAGDNIIDTYGGGVCQATSTLYDAVLEAELEVTERHNHTMRIHYVEPALDATISDDTVDFRFKNNTDSPIFIEARAEDGEVSFRIYGHETRDPNRSIRYESRILTTTDYETVYKVDEKAPFGSIREISGEEGMQTELWKIISMNGEYESEEKVNSSTYSPTNHSYLVGIDGASSGTVNAIYNAVASKSLDQIYDAVYNGTAAD